jgi:hypothetical protein
MYIVINLDKPEDSKVYQFKQTISKDIDIHRNSINNNITHIKRYIIINTDLIKGNKVNNFKR